MISTFEEQERQDPEQRENTLMSRLPALIEAALNTTGWAEILQGTDPAQIGTREALQALPITNKLDLARLQSQHPPLGGLYAASLPQLQRIFMSPGPIFEAQGRSNDWWRTARPLRALGLEPGHIVQNCFSYHLTPGAFLIDEGARALGCTVLPAGPGQTEQQVNAMASLNVDAYAGTPSFLKIIFTRAQELGRDIGSLKKALVSAEALPASLRQWLRSNGVTRVLQFYGTADIGAIAYETADENDDAYPGLILNEDLILEIVDPATGQSVPDGQLGEIVITSLNPLYPLVRFGTGDLSSILPGRSPCQRTNVRITGWQGRVDQLVKVRGMFIHPADVASVTQRHALIQKVQLVVERASGNDTLTLHCLVPDATEISEQTRTAIATTFRELTRLRADIQFVPTLPKDAPTIKDMRSLE